MRKILFLFAITTLVTFSGCNQGEITLLKEQVAELKVENAALRSGLDEANMKVAKYETLNSQMTEQMNAFKGLMPDVGGIGEAMEAAKELGLEELKNFDREKFMEKAKEKIGEKVKEKIGL